MEDIVKEQKIKTKLSFCGGVNHSAENVSKVSDRKRKKVVLLVIKTTDKRNGHLGNVLDVNLNIT